MTCEKDKREKERESVILSEKTEKKHLKCPKKQLSPILFSSLSFSAKEKKKCACMTEFPLVRGGMGWVETKKQKKTKGKGGKGGRGYKKKRVFRTPGPLSLSRARAHFG